MHGNKFGVGLLLATFGGKLRVHIAIHITVKNCRMADWQTVSELVKGETLDTI